jgi:hypothetical protein
VIPFRAPASPTRRECGLCRTALAEHSRRENKRMTIRATGVEGEDSLINLLGPEGDESLKAAWGPRISDPTEASDNSSVQRRIVHLSHT